MSFIRSPDATQAARQAPSVASTGPTGALGVPITRGTFLRAALCATAAAALAKASTAAAAAEPMHRRRIPSTGALLPVVGCGTWRTFDVGASTAEREQIAGVLRVLFEAGGSVIDTSPMYGAAEQVLGDALAAMGSRPQAFIATKVWTTGQAPGIEQMRRSMALLRTDRIELMQVHNLVDWRTQLRTLREWKRDARIQYLGLTHYTPSAHDELEAILRREPVDFVQIDYSIADRAAERRLLPLAADRGIAVIVNQPFGGGGLLRTLGDRPLPGWAADIGCRSWAQVLLKFVLAHPAVTCVIPGSGKPEHMRDNVAAGFGVLPDAALRQRMITDVVV